MLLKVPLLAGLRGRRSKYYPTRPERAEAPSPGQRPGYNSNQQVAL
uniref:Uncharacterized protein n=2 Tax=unclassified Caudoviricetes TaxID=2788787 RepID=A0A8S5VB82_9CAUD|nr:MAG TPA: hypothetical protein [Siphoviridae sp. ctfrT39]DAG03988.1 MAG TPA: hypothetical protein [Siphoviridae sp. ct0vA12]